MRLSPDLQVTYCTNIHASNGVDDVAAQVQHYGTYLKAALSPNAPFGVGLRLSGDESRVLVEPDRLAAFRDMLAAHGLYVFTMNGFPYGPFHNQRVKDDVHAPDWRDPERVAYTKRLAHILADLLPDGMDGGISTSPLSYKPWLGTVEPETWQLFVLHLIDVIAELAALRERTDALIHIDIEPEPDGLIETSTELVAFFNDWLLPIGTSLLGDRLGVTPAAAEALIRDHIRVCWDTCHVAVAYENPREVLARFTANDIRVGKIQVSSALQVLLDQPREPVAEALAPFVESTYLHQVVQRNRDGSLTQFPDLDQALPHLHDEQAAEWRIHFHVPIFIKDFGRLDSTQDTIVETLALLNDDPFTHHLEIETYTWHVLPPALKKPLDASIRREFEWVLGGLVIRN